MPVPDSLLLIKSVTPCAGTTKFPPPIIAALLSNSLWFNEYQFFVSLRREILPLKCTTNEEKKL
jgi:hypothetical protein